MHVMLVSLPKSSDIRKGKESIPVASLYLCAYLEKNGLDCDYIDFSILTSPDESGSNEEFIIDTLTEKFDPPPRILGFNCFSSYQFPLILSVAEKIKAKFPEISICVGGSHPTFFAKEILQNCPFIDHVIIGEGEQQLLALTRKILRLTNSNLRDIQSIGYRDQNGRVVINKRKEYLKELDVEARQLWSRIDLEAYYSDHSFWNNPKNKEIRLAVPIVSSRSCPFHCIFCSASKIMGPVLRNRDPYNVVDEIEFLTKERGQNYYEFVDDNINVNRRHAEIIFSEIIKRKLDIQFSLSSGIHIASADDHLIHLMAEAGLAMIKLPIEHGNDYIRNQIIGKKLARDDIYRITGIIKQYDVFTFGLFIMGFPEDTPKTLEDSYQMMCEIGLDIYEMASLIPFPGTPLFRQCIRDKLLVSAVNQKDLWRGVINFDASEHDKIYIKPYRMSLDELRQYRQKFNDIRLFSEKVRGFPNAN